MKRNGFLIGLPQERIEWWSIGDIMDDSFPNSTSRRSRVTSGGVSPTISATNMSHILYLYAFETI